MSVARFFPFPQTFDETCARLSGHRNTGGEARDVDASLISERPELIFMYQPPATLNQLLALADEAERFIATSAALVESVAMDDARQACAIARGHLDLVRLHGEPICIDDIERAFARVASGIDDEKQQRRFLTKLRSVVGWWRFTTS